MRKGSILPLLYYQYRTISLLPIWFKNTPPLLGLSKVDTQSHVTLDVLMRWTPRGMPTQCPNQFYLSPSLVLPPLAFHLPPPPLTPLFCLSTYFCETESFFRDYVKSHKKLSDLGYIQPSSCFTLAVKNRTVLMRRGVVGVAVVVLSYFYEVSRRVN